MSWSDDGYDDEFISFQETTYNDVIEPSPNKRIIYVRVFWTDIKDYVNQWNKNRKKVRVHKITRCQGTPFDSDFEVDYDLWLDLGARLFRELKRLQGTKPRPKYIRVVKDMNPLDKFDTWYHAEPYKLQKQKILDDIKK